MAIKVPVRLRSIESYIIQIHGERRPLVLVERDILRDFAELIVSHIEEAWPVDTGWSRDHFRFTITAHSNWIGFEIINQVGYAQFVHRAGTPAEPPLWQTLIPAVIQAVAPSLIDRLKREVDNTENLIRLRRRAGHPEPFLSLLQQPALPRMAVQ